jgi:hypothetical protein
MHGASARPCYARVGNPVIQADAKPVLPQSAVHFCKGLDLVFAAACSSGSMLQSAANNKCPNWCLCCAGQLRDTTDTTLEPLAAHNTNTLCQGTGLAQDLGGCCLTPSNAITLQTHRCISQQHTSSTGSDAFASLAGTRKAVHKAVEANVVSVQQQSQWANSKAAHRY